MPRKPPFPDLLVDEPGSAPPLRGFSVGYEAGQWRHRLLADALGEYLPEFALTYKERRGFTDRSAVQLFKKAAALMYATDKYKKRGEFGELILHFLLAEAYGSEPAISKMFFKDAVNDTVKGFDCVHVIQADDGLELWLGEVKFYSDLQSAVDAAVVEIREHSKFDYLRSEFAAIMNKIDDSWPHAGALRAMIDRRTSLDQIVTRIRVPVLLTYDSAVVGAHSADGEPYPTAFREEVVAGHGLFAKRDLKSTLSVHLLLLPLKSKAELVEILQAKLVTWQNI
jgi:hypothetical protein